MSASGPMSNPGSFAMLRQLAKKRPDVERCEMCSLALYADHQHLVDVETRKLICACEACAILFSNQTSAKFRRVPKDVRRISSIRMSEAQWGSLLIPIEIAFFFRDSRKNKMLAFYPSPAGAVESTLSLGAWSEIERDNPELVELLPDVEAFLVNRIGTLRGIEPAYYIVPIDECYKLVGLIRMHWRGLSGGTEVWREVAAFFEQLKIKSGVPDEAETQNA